MATKKHLATVPEGAARTKKPDPRNIVEALDGTGRDVLAAMRKALAKKLDDGDVSSNAIASAYKELRELDRLIRQSDAATAASRDAGNDDADETFDASAV